jgi:hypothetical protein
MVDEVRVTVVAGIVYTPGVGQVVAKGVGTTGAGELDGTTTEDVVTGAALLVGATDEVAGGGGKYKVPSPVMVV